MAPARSGALGPRLGVGRLPAVLAILFCSCISTAHGAFYGAEVVLTNGCSSTIDVVVDINSDNGDWTYSNSASISPGSSYTFTGCNLCAGGVFSCQPFTWSYSGEASLCGKTWSNSGSNEVCGFEFGFGGGFSEKRSLVCEDGCTAPPPPPPDCDYGVDAYGGCIVPEPPEPCKCCEDYGDYSDCCEYGDSDYGSNRCEAPPPPPPPDPSPPPTPVPAECDASSDDCFSFAVKDPPSPSDAVAMMAADLAEMAYNTMAEVEEYAKNVLKATSVYELSDATTGTEGFVMVGSDTIMVVFRGTASEEDWDTNADVDLTDLGVHSGFANAVASVYAQLTDVLTRENPSNEKYVVFSGHSLGGALAITAAADLESDNTVTSSVDGVYTFGSPRAGDATFASSYDGLGLSSKTLRYVHYKDPVPLMPPTSTGYRHVGRAVVLPLNKDSCQESSTSDYEYPTCEVNGGLFEAVVSVVGAFKCGLLTPLVGGGFCAGVSLAEMIADEVEPNVANAMCQFLGDIYLNGNLCCLAGDWTATGKFPTQYHKVDQYSGALANGCLDDCSFAAYQTCGVGWTAEDQAELDASVAILDDPLSDLTEEQTAEAQQTIRDAIAKANSTSSPNPNPGNSPSSPSSPSSPPFVNETSITPSGMAAAAAPGWFAVAVMAVLGVAAN